MWMNDYTEYKIAQFDLELPIIVCPACGRRGKLYSNALRIVHRYSAFIGAGKWDACDVSDQQLTDCMENYRNPVKKERSPRVHKPPVTAGVTVDTAPAVPKKRGRPRKIECAPVPDDTFQSALDDLFTLL